jgi:multidrug efflux pump subunit AcrB
MPPTSTASAASSASRRDSLTLVFILALFFIFLVLAAQFESFVDPFVILLSVPLSMVGALLACNGQEARSMCSARSG